MPSLLSFLACFTGKTGELRNGCFIHLLVEKLKKSGVLILAIKLSTDAGGDNITYNITTLRGPDYFPCYLGCNIGQIAEYKGSYTPLMFSVVSTETCSLGPW